MNLRYWSRSGQLGSFFLLDTSLFLPQVGFVFVLHVGRRFSFRDDCLLKRGGKAIVHPEDRMGVARRDNILNRRKRSALRCERFFGHGDDLAKSPTANLDMLPAGC